MHFGAGVRPDIGKVILAQAAPPANIESMLASALVVAEQAPNDVAPDAVAPSFDFAELQSQISELTEVVSAIASKQPFNFSKMGNGKWEIWTLPEPSPYPTTEQPRS